MTHELTDLDISLVRWEWSPGVGHVRDFVWSRIEPFAEAYRFRILFLDRENPPSGSYFFTHVDDWLAPDRLPRLLAKLTSLYQTLPANPLLARFPPDHPAAA